VRVTLVRNGDDIGTQSWDPDKSDVVFVDEEPLEKIAVRDARHHPDPFVCYYVRVEDQFSQTQWTSPIWLDLE
jgi:hypothetical protein